MKIAGNSPHYEGMRHNAQRAASTPLCPTHICLLAVPDLPALPACQVPAKRDLLYLLAGPRASLRLPVPPTLRNKGNYIVSLR